LDLEDPQALAAVLQQSGAPSGEFEAFLAGEGRHELDQIRRAAEAAGVFGVPSFLFADGDLYWGREHLPSVRERLRASR
jgi:2-hydroxychromene-2-carboxylate isomerase